MKRTEVPHEITGGVVEQLFEIYTKEAVLDIELDDDESDDYFGNHVMKFAVYDQHLPLWMERFKHSIDNTKNAGVL